MAPALPPHLRAAKAARSAASSTLMDAIATNLGSQARQTIEERTANASHTDQHTQEIENGPSLIPQTDSVRNTFSSIDEVAYEAQPPPLPAYSQWATEIERWRIMAEIWEKLSERQTQLERRNKQLTATVMQQAERIDELEAKVKTLSNRGW
nr:hypothetical protein CFP56_32457 [Quercus suber]